jgi:hypothetical protein
MLKLYTSQLKKAKTAPLQLSELVRIIYQILLVTALISLRWLLDGNMGSVNEVDVLPLALQHIDPTWILGDWYLNQPAGYRLLFETFAGHLILAWGFLGTSIVGRLACYGLVASGLVSEALRPSQLLTALCCLAFGQCWSITIAGWHSCWEWQRPFIFWWAAGHS